MGAKRRKTLFTRLLGLLVAGSLGGCSYIGPNVVIDDLRPSFASGDMEFGGNISLAWEYGNKVRARYGAKVSARAELKNSLGLLFIPITATATYLVVSA